MGQVLIDTNIFIHIFFKGDVSKARLLDKITPIVCAPVYIELMQGATQSTKIRGIIKSYLDQYSLIHINEDISKETLKLMMSYGNSHGLQMGDAFIAATAMVCNLPLYTLKISGSCLSLNSTRSRSLKNNRGKRVPIFYRLENYCL